MPQNDEVPGDVGVNLQQSLAGARCSCDAGQQPAETIDIERLADVVERTQLHRLDGGVHCGLAGHQNNLARRVEGANGAEHIEPVDVGHPEVDNHRIRLERRQLREGVAGVRPGDNGEPEARANRSTRTSTVGSSSIASSVASVLIVGRLARWGTTWMHQHASWTSLADSVWCPATRFMSSTARSSRRYLRYGSGLTVAEPLVVAARSLCILP